MTNFEKHFATPEAAAKYLYETDICPCDPENPRCAVRNNPLPNGDYDFGQCARCVIDWLDSEAE